MKNMWTRIGGTEIARTYAKTIVEKLPPPLELVLHIRQNPNILMGSVPALIYCVSSKNIEMIEIFVQNGADINLYFTHFDNEITVFLASFAYIGIIQTLDFDIAYTLLKYGADPNLPNKTNGYTALHYLVERYQDLPTNSTPAPMYIELLLEHGADTRLKNNAGLTAYDIAIQNHADNLVLLKLLKP